MQVYLYKNLWNIYATICLKGEGGIAPMAPPLDPPMSAFELFRNAPRNWRPRSQFKQNRHIILSDKTKHESVSYLTSGKSGQTPCLIYGEPVLKSVAFSGSVLFRKWRRFLYSGQINGWWQPREWNQQVSASRFGAPDLSLIARPLGWGFDLSDELPSL